jgi:hypothetical protein
MLPHDHGLPTSKRFVLLWTFSPTDASFAGFSRSRSPLATTSWSTVNYAPTFSPPIETSGLSGETTFNFRRVDVGAVVVLSM